MNVAYSVLKCRNENLVLSEFEKDMHYKQYSRKIDRIAFNYYGYSNRRRALLAAKCKLIICVLLEHTDKSMNVWIGPDELYELTDIPNKETLKYIKLMSEAGLIIRHRGNGLTLLPPEQEESSIIEVYTALLNNDEK